METFTTFCTIFIFFMFIYFLILTLLDSFNVIDCTGRNSSVFDFLVKCLFLLVFVIFQIWFWAWTVWNILLSSSNHKIQLHNLMKFYELCPHFASLRGSKHLVVDHWWRILSLWDGLHVWVWAAGGCVCRWLQRTVPARARTTANLSWPFQTFCGNWCVGLAWCSPSRTAQPQWHAQPAPPQHTTAKRQ